MNTTLPDDEDLALTLRALGHPVRLQILRILVDRSGHCCCTEVTGCLALAQSTVSQHLKVLLDAGIIERQAVGTRNQYTVCTARLGAFAQGLSGFLSRLDDAGPPLGEETSRPPLAPACAGPQGLS